MPSAVVDAEASAFVDIQNQLKLSVTDEAEISASAAQGLAMVFHELFTNAIKHGALSTERGSVEIGIDRVEDVVSILWKERDGPVIKAESGSGFGSTLISNALAADGAAEQIFLPDGLECRLTVRTK